MFRTFWMITLHSFSYGYMLNRLLITTYLYKNNNILKCNTYQTKSKYIFQIKLKFDHMWFSWTFDYNNLSNNLIMLYKMTFFHIRLIIRGRLVTNFKKSIFIYQKVFLSVMFNYIQTFFFKKKKLHF